MWQPRPTNSRRRDDRLYCQKRALEEQLAAARATCPQARERHEEMAEMYRFRALAGELRLRFASEPVDEPETIDEPEPAAVTLWL